ncbi:MAG: hypothetical protein U0838_16645 [Chloroflexota bacterium]
MAATTTSWSTATASPTSSSRWVRTAIVDGGREGLLHRLRLGGGQDRPRPDDAQPGLRYPGYGWERNAGYATLEHREAIKAHGLTPHHRKSWQAIQALLAGDQLSLFDAPAGAGARRPRRGVEAADLNADLVEAAPSWSSSAALLGA